ncbi:hypothetical protein AVEN_90918-1, partial [Araneus ventricosus]
IPWPGGPPRLPDRRFECSRPDSSEFDLMTWIKCHNSRKWKIQERAVYSCTVFMSDQSAQNYGIRSKPSCRGHGVLVLRSRSRGRRVPDSKPDSTEDLSCMGPDAR